MDPKEKLKNDFLSLGLKAGDIVFMRADISQILKSKDGLKAKDILEVLLDAVGKDGTVVSPAYTQSNFIKRDKKNIKEKKKQSKNKKRDNPAIKKRELRKNFQTNQKKVVTNR